MALLDEFMRSDCEYLHWFCIGPTHHLPISL
jgi:hypothetical protein